MAEIRGLGRINTALLEKEFGKIRTDKIIVTNERLLHIQERHPQDYELFEKYGQDSVQNPDYIIRDMKNEGTVFMVKKLPDTNLNVVVRVVLDTDKNVRTMKRKIFEVEIVLLRTLWVKRNVGRGTPAKYLLFM